jgi:hypothetical protein
MKNRIEIIKAIFEFIMIPIVSYAVYTLQDMNKNIENLNVKVSVIIAERALEREQSKEYNQRLLLLEKECKR